MGFTSEEACLLLHNKFVVVLGDSIPTGLYPAESFDDLPHDPQLWQFQRTVYKDLVLFLQKAKHLTKAQLRSKCEPSFEGDHLLEASQLTNGIEFREARQFCRPFHLLRFHFLTRVYSPYVESILEGFRSGPSPDILIINSCVWDISRYGCSSRREYAENLERLFARLREVLQPNCLVIWSLAMPLGSQLKGGFLPPELQPLAHSLRSDVVEANFQVWERATSHGFDVLDMHFHFRRWLLLRASDGIHWNQLAHRYITQLLLQHIAEAWGVTLGQAGPPASVLGAVRIRGASPLIRSIAVENHFTSTLPAPCSGYTSFHNPPRPDAPVLGAVRIRGDSPLVRSSAVENHFTSTLPASCPGYTSFHDSPRPDASVLGAVRIRGDSPLVRSSAVENHFTSTLPAPCPGYTSFHDTPQPDVSVLGAVRICEDSPLVRSSAVENHFTSNLPASCLRYMSFHDPPRPDEQGGVWAVAPLPRHAVENTVSFDIRWRLECHRQVMRRRLCLGRVPVPYSLDQQGQCRPGHSDYWGSSR